MHSKRKRTIFFLVLFIVAIMYCGGSVFAHSGRTDSNGGHTNHSTGEYHWHHGEPAHQHEDLDGDGYPEYCPYRKDSSNSNDARYQSKENTWDYILIAGVCVIFGLPIAASFVSTIYRKFIKPITQHIKNKEK